jgi:hypothetical protein
MIGFHKFTRDHAICTTTLGIMLLYLMHNVGGRRGIVTFDSLKFSEKEFFLWSSNHW